MKAVSLKAFPRTLARRAGAKQLRMSGRVPAVLYGRAAPTRNIEVDAKELEDLIHHSASETILVDLAVQSEATDRRLAFVQEVQHHPLSGQLVHIDFHQVADDEPVTVALPVETVGTAAGVKAGGVLEHVLFKVKVRGLPKDLPEFIEVDVTALEIGNAVHLGELKLPASVKVLGDPDIPVIAVAAPITEAEEAAALEAATTPLAEPEMIKEKKEGELGEAAEGVPAKGKAEGAAAKGKPETAAAPAKGKAEGTVAKGKPETAAAPAKTKAEAKPAEKKGTEKKK
jgi:large subunit ribosomal protein L25